MQPNSMGGPSNQWSNQQGNPQPNSSGGPGSNAGGQASNQSGYPPQNGQYPGGYGRPSAGNPYGQMAAPVKRRHHRNGLLIPLIISIVLLLGISGFAIWAFMERGTYKDKSDAIVAKEVELAKQETASEKDKEFVEKEKEPFKEYKGPSQFGSLHLSYPKTWSAFITEDGSSNQSIDGYMHPNYVPGLKSGTDFALRFQVVDRSYDTEMKKFESKVKQGKVTVSPYRAKNVPDVLGSRVVGEINKGQNDTMVLFPLRDKTLIVWTESNQFLKDFDDNVLSALIFVP